MKKILFIDDKTSSLTVGKLIVQGLGHEVVTIDSGVEALKFLASKDVAGIDIIFLDLMMPELNGFAVLAFINRLNIQIPVIVQTATDEDTIRKAKALGAIDYLSKPYKRQDVAKMIEKHTAVGRIVPKHSCSHC